MVQLFKLLRNSISNLLLAHGSRHREQLAIGSSQVGRQDDSCSVGIAIAVTVVGYLIAQLVVQPPTADGDRCVCLTPIATFHSSRSPHARAAVVTL